MAQILTGSWEGKSGTEVRTLLQNTINNLDTELKGKAGDDFSFDVDELGQNITLLFTKGDGTKFSKTIEVKPASKASMIVNIGDDDHKYAEVFGHGQDLKIPFNYEVSDNGLKVGGLTASVTAVIKLMSGALIKSLKTVLLRNTVRTSTGVNREGTLTILGSDLFVGVNKIDITFTVDYNGLVSKTSFVEVEAIKLELNVNENVGGKHYDDIFTATEQLNFTFGISGTSKTVQTVVYYGGYPALMTETSSITTTFNDLKVQASNSYSTVSYINTYGRQRLFFQSRVKDDPTIVSNIVMIDMISKQNGSTLFEGVAFSTKLNVSSIDYDNPTVSTKQYDEVIIPILYYSTEDCKVIRNLNGLEIAPTNVLSYTPDIDRTLDFISNFKQVGVLTFSIYNNDNNDQSLILNIDVLSSGSSISEPIGNELSLSTQTTTSDTREWKSGNYSTTFNKFDWQGNGFINGALIFNNGASAIINYPACTSNAYTISFRFSTTNSLTGEKLISCVSENTGFEIYPEEAIIYNNGEAISTEFSSNDVHEVTLVSYGNDYLKLMNIYIDGSIQCSKAKTALARLSSDTYIHIKAEDNLLNLYNINAYKRALSFTEIQSLYCLNLSDSTSIANYIKANDVFDSSVVSDFMGDKVTIAKLPIGARYMVLESYKAEGEAESLDNDPWKTINGYITDNPETYKGIRHLLGSIKLIVKTEDGSAHPANFYAERATLSALGTSSMAYPAKNFRIYFKKAITSSCPYYNETGVSSDGKKGDFGFTKNFYTGISADFDPTINTDYKSTSAKYSLFSKNYPGDENVERDSAPAKLFCLKADFAESSGSHNTGFARMANYALTKSENICPSREVSLLLPMQYALDLAGKNAITKTDIRSTIDGRPIYLFVKHAGELDSEAIYYGKYNMNNEKSSEDVFGFVGTVDYYNNEIVRTESTRLATLFGDTEGNFEATHFKYGIVSNKYDDSVSDYVNPNECWEFSNNTFNLQNAPGEYTNIGAFLYPYTPNSSYPLYNLYKNYNPFTVKGNDGSLAWLCYNDKTNDFGLAWEYRFPGLETEAGKEDEGHKRYLNGLLPYLLGSLYKWLYKHNSTLWTGTDKNRMLSEFAKDLHLYFNVNYLLKYYVLTKWFGNSDQRIKNCMLSFYCDPTATNNTNSEYPMGHMRAFYIFYDNDTILGVDNTGALSNPWNMQEDKYPGYGKHAIWDNLEACYRSYISGNKTLLEVYNLGKLIEDAYKSLRKVLTDDVIKKYFETDQVNKYCDAIYNVDAEIKYYRPSRHMNLLPGATLDEPNRVANIHGNRKFHRELWLNKRSTWFDAKFGGGNNSNYLYAFKVQGAEGSGDGGNIRLTSALNEWRFYINSAGQSIDQVIENNSSLLNAGLSCVIPVNNISVSDHVNLIALYACSEIDIKEFKTATYISELKHGNILPYLKNLIINTYDSDIKYITTEAMGQLVSAEICPNLEKLYISNILTPINNKSVNTTDKSTRFGLLDLSTLNKVTFIDARGTAVSIILPNSSMLNTLYLENPTLLKVANKPNLSTFQVASIEDLTSIEIGEGNKSSVNETIMEYALIKLNDNQLFPVTINYGNANISDRELALLEQLADKKMNGASNISVRGSIVNPSISVEQQSKFKEAFGSGIIVSTEDTGEFKFTFTSTTLREGADLTIYTNKLLDTSDVWTWSIDGETKGTLNDTIKITKTDSSIKFEALPSGVNNSETHLLQVSATVGTDTVISDIIPIQYIAVENISLSSNKLIIDELEVADITIVSNPSNNTKLDLINTSKLWNVSGGTIEDSVYTLTTTTDGWIKLTLSNINNSEGKLIVSNLLNFIYNKTLANVQNIGSTKKIVPTDSSKTSDSLYWIWQMIFKALGRDKSDAISTIRISDLRSIDFGSNISAVTSQINDVDVIHDMEYAKYFNYSNSTFTIPTSIYFSNFSVPEVSNIVTVNWNLIDAVKDSYKNIVFNSSIVNANIRITSNSSWLPNLKLDFSNCPNITKIYNGNGATSSGLASINITYLGSEKTMPSNGVFVYPPNLTLLGNMNFESDGSQVDSSNYPSTMFNLLSTEGTLISINDSKTYSPIYPIDDIPSKKLKIGAIYGYPIANTTNSFNYTISNITDTYYTFYGLYVHPNNAASEGINLTGVLTIGSGTFDSSTNPWSVVINKDVTYIGSRAFAGYQGTITSTSSENGKLKFLNLKRIGNYAFSTIAKSLSIELNSSSLSGGGIGEGAFNLKSGSTEYHSIYINGNTAFAYDAKSFGTGKKNSLYISSSLQTVMSQSSDTWNALKSNVKIFVDGTQING